MCTRLEWQNFTRQILYIHRPLLQLYCTSSRCAAVGTAAFFAWIVRCQGGSATEQTQTHCVIAKIVRPVLLEST